MPKYGIQRSKLQKASFKKKAFKIFLMRKKKLSQKLNSTPRYGVSKVKVQKPSFEKKGLKIILKKNILKKVVSKADFCTEVYGFPKVKVAKS